MIVKPTRKNVLVAENKNTVKSESGLILDTAVSAMESKTATVLAVGPEVKFVKPGDTIYLEWNKGKIVKLGDAQRVMISEDNIVGVVEE
jgi:co-chaperonin GroES (HSP10)